MVSSIAWSKSLGLKMYVFCQYRAAFRSLSCTARICIRTHVAFYFLTVWTSSQTQSRFNPFLCEMFFPRFGTRQRAKCIRLSVSCKTRFLLPLKQHSYFEIKKLESTNRLSESNLILAPFQEDLYFFLTLATFRFRGLEF